MTRLQTSVHDQALACLLCNDVDQKIVCVRALQQAWHAGALSKQAAEPIREIVVPGRPSRPELVAPAQLARRGLGTEQGRAAFIHAIAHIEFNAINLALDAVYRFRDLPDTFYTDWLKVAEEEAQHFSLLRQRLREMNQEYGDFSAHNGLWEMTVKTAHDPLVRMALVPRVLEARGLDVTPGMIERLQSAGDTRTVEILDIILRDEIGHVSIGSHWYHYFCDQRGLDRDGTFKKLVMQYMNQPLRGPFHTAARLQAGFTMRELEQLTGVDKYE
ncbi:MAG TPA: ferritin-like domain-containing protein [Gammaproteobacteria bacterium]|nr:ferritin-like domain-containing protein [Gammaproteobacteria bacterium]